MVSDIYLSAKCRMGHVHEKMVNHYGLDRLSN